MLLGRRVYAHTVICCQMYAAKLKLTSNGLNWSHCLTSSATFCVCLRALSRTVSCMPHITSHAPVQPRAPALPETLKNLRGVPWRVKRPTAWRRRSGNTYYECGGYGGVTEGAPAARAA
jgi:hypothetical protein